MAHFNFGQGSLKGKRFVQFPSYPKGEKAAMSSILWVPPEFISGFLGGSETCPAQHSILVKCFTVFTPCNSSAWRAWGLHCCNCSLRAVLPAAVLYSTAPAILHQETNCFHYCLACHPTGLISSFSTPRYPLSSVQSLGLTAVILAHGPTALRTGISLSSHMGLLEKCPSLIFLMFIADKGPAALAAAQRCCTHTNQ